MGIDNVKYYAWFAGEEPDDSDTHWFTMEWEDWESLVAEKFLDYAYSNMDGWEWMPKDNGKSVVRVKRDGSNSTTDFTFELEYEPMFTAYEKTS